MCRAVVVSGLMESDEASAIDLSGTLVLFETWI